MDIGILIVFLSVMHYEYLTSVKGIERTKKKSKIHICCRSGTPLIRTVFTQLFGELIVIPDNVLGEKCEEQEWGVG